MKAKAKNRTLDLECSRCAPRLESIFYFIFLSCGVLYYNITKSAQGRGHTIEIGAILIRIMDETPIVAIVTQGLFRDNNTVCLCVGGCWEGDSQLSHNTHHVTIFFQC